MTNLTEQWKRGELESGYYYIVTKYIEFPNRIDFYNSSAAAWSYHSSILIEEVLAPVPSYDHFVELTEKDKENLQLKQKVTSRNKKLQKYKKLKGELATLASNRNILIKRLKEENEKLKSTLNDVDYFFTYGITRWGVVDLRRSVKEVLI